jgi:hypothetical protein
MAEPFDAGVEVHQRRLSRVTPELDSGCGRGAAGICRMTEFVS